MKHTFNGWVNLVCGSTLMILWLMGMATTPYALIGLCGVMVWGYQSGFWRYLD